jgi:Tfp pilus assembly protein PilO
MSSFLDKLNLQPQEKRILAAVLVVAAIVITVFFIWPKRGDLAKAGAALEKSQKTLASYQAEIARVPQYEARLRELEGQGSAVLPEEQALQLMRAVQKEAQEHKVPITSTRSGTPGATPTTSTNTFFDEQTVSIGVSTGEKELVEFLHALGSGNSMIRVRDMDLKPDPPRYRLNGSVTLVASYQKKPKIAPKPAAKPPAMATNAAPKTITISTSSPPARAAAATNNSPPKKP